MAAAKAAATSNADPTVPGVERIANAVAVVGKDEPQGARPGRQQTLRS